MRWATFTHPGLGGAEAGLGLVQGDEIFVTPTGTTLLGLLGTNHDGLARAGEATQRDPTFVLPVSDVELLPPIPRPPAVRDFMTFEQHVEGGWKFRGLELPALFFEIPVFYFTNPRALLGDGAEIPVPPGCERLDFELEVAAIVGRDCTNVTPAEAESAIAGYCIMNDWSARDIQMREMGLDLGPAKGKDTATTLGPWMVTPDEIAERRSGAGHDLAMIARVNGVEVGRDLWSNAHWSFPELLAYASRGTTVSAGDVLGSGTCGNGCLAELRSRNDQLPWLSIGDVVELEIEALGTVSNQVVDGAPLIALRD